MCTIAAGDVSRRNRFFIAIGASEPGHYAIALFMEVNELDGPLDVDAELLEPADEQSLMLILWKNDHVGERAQPLAQHAELHVANLLAFCPQIRGHELAAVSHDVVSDAGLPVELQRARVDHERPRSGAWFRDLVDDSNHDAEP